MMRVWRILKAALAGDDLLFASLAALAFAGIKERRRKAVGIILRQLARGHPDCRLGLITALRSMEAGAITALPKLVELYRSPDCTVTVKAAILRSLGCIVGTPSGNKPKNRRPSAGLKSAPPSWKKCCQANGRLYGVQSTA